MLNISVIIPAYQSREHLVQCLGYLDACAHRPHQVIVVDGGSRDGSAEAAAAAGATVVRIPDGPKGPAFARNRGAAIATGDLLLFLHADVAVHRRTLDQISAIFERHRDVAALFGSYDDKPAAGTFVSRYRNLLHHFVHQEGRQEATTPPSDRMPASRCGERLQSVQHPEPAAVHVRQQEHGYRE